MTIQELTDRLQSERVVALTDAEWAELENGFDEVERHDTMIAGDLLIIRASVGLAAVERPHTDERVVRLLRDPDEVRQFVRERLSLYERMWDGCGCKVDYYS